MQRGEHERAGVEGWSALPIALQRTLDASMALSDARESGIGEAALWRGHWLVLHPGVERNIRSSSDLVRQLPPTDQNQHKIEYERAS